VAVTVALPTQNEGEAMRHLTKGIAALAVASLALFASACNKGPAEAALSVADQALTAAKPEIEKYVPEELSALTSAAQAARAEFEKGNYTEALKAAQGLPAKIEAAVALAGEKKAQLTAAWTALSASLPGLVQSINEKVTALGAAKALPKGMTREMLASAQTDLGAVTEAWTGATAAFQGGDVPQAVKTAKDVQAKAEALARLLGLAPAAAAVPAADLAH
jgi:hypothetical protein